MILHGANQHHKIMDRSVFKEPKIALQFKAAFLFCVFCGSKEMKILSWSFQESTQTADSVSCYEKLNMQIFLHAYLCGENTCTSGSL